MVRATNAIATAIFDVLLAPLGHGPVWFDLALWSVGCGFVALVIYKYVSNQAGIGRAKDRVTTHLLEIRLWRHDPLVVLAATGRVLAWNGLYLAHNLVPMAVLLAPMLAVLAQIESHYAFDPAPVGRPAILEVALDAARTDIAAKDVSLTVPPGVVVEAGPVRTPDREVVWRLRADRPGDHVLELHAGPALESKVWSAGGGPRKVSSRRTRTWEALLYPGEDTLPADSPFVEIRVDCPERRLPWAPDGELGVLAVFFVLSLVAGYALKDLVGVRL